MASNSIIKNLIIISLTVLLTITAFWAYQQYQNRQYEEHLQDYSDSLSVEEIGIDTVGALPQSNPPTPSFMSAVEVFEKYSENKIAFNKANEDKKFEFTGNISEIRKSVLGCSVLTFNITDNYDYSIGNINCLNCDEGVDNWENQILKLKVGDRVKITGYYSSALVDNTMTFDRSKVAKF